MPKKAKFLWCLCVCMSVCPYVRMSVCASVEKQKDEGTDLDDFWWVATSCQM